ncbi:MAG TPA: hypothetical protein VFV63_00385, partial [Ilumatobacteraceae bacterium]|nr:hypothetical protein [Ilumatobacteraceae bacterium]
MTRNDSGNDTPDVPRGPALPKVTRRSVLFGAVGVVGTAAFLAACGDDDDEGGETGDTEGSGDTTADGTT